MKKVRKHTQNVWIDILSFVCMILLTVTGILLKYKIPPGSHKASLWGLSRHEWGDIHFWIALVVVITIAVHLLLHIPWIQGVLYPKKNRMQHVIMYSIGLGLLLVLSAAMLFGNVIHHG